MMGFEDEVERLPGYTHMGIMESPAVQERILSEVSE